MNPSLYDLLDVDQDASDAEIRAAWKAAIADLDPSDRRFRAYNQAAEVLLDADRRTTYDAELAAAAPPAEERPVEDSAPAEAADETAQAPAVRKAGAGRILPVVPAWLLIVVGVVTVALVGATAYLWTQPSSDSVEEATRTAQSAAERAVVPILSYDHRRLDQDQEAAHTYMTSGYREEYDKFFDGVVRENAPRTGTVVSVEVVGSGIVRSGSDRVEILVFVNRPTTNKQTTEPVIYKDQVTATMQKVGDDWLVDDLKTSPAAAP